MNANLINRICLSTTFTKIPIKRILTIVIGIFIAMGTYAQSLNQKVTIKANQINLKEFFKQIEQQSTYTFVYRDIILDEKKDISVDEANKPLEDVLSQVLSNKNLDYKVSNKTIVLIKKEVKQDTHSASAKKKVVTGVIKDGTGEPLIGVSVGVKGTTSGTMTDVDGKYSIEVPNNGILTFSYLGYEKQEIVANDQTNINVILKDDAKLLDEVVVVGYGTIKKRDHTGSLSSVDSQKLQDTHKTSIGGALQGQIAGVDMVKSGSKPGAGFNIMIRGVNKIQAEPGGDSRTDMNNVNPPLYVVDGMFVTSINDISPDDIERIDVLKDASSTAIYGSRGSNGVVIVTTKRGSEGKSHVEYNGTISFGRATNQPKFMDAEGYVQYRLDRDKGTHWEDKTYQPNLEKILGTQQYNNYINGKSIDWVDEVLDTSISHSHSARVYGNGKGLAYTFGLSYTNEDGIIGHDGYERYNVSTSVDKQLNKQLKAGANIYTAYELTQNSGTETFRTLYRLNPLTDKYNEDGSLRLFPDATIGNLSNPFLEMESLITEKKTLHVFGNVYLEFKPAEWLKFTTTFTPDITFARYGEYRGRDTKSSKGNQTATRAIYDTENLTKYTWDNLIYGEKKIDDHALNLMLGSSWYKRMYESAHMRADNMPTDHYQWYNMGAGTMKEMSSSYVQEQLMSYFSRFNYTFKDKYLLTMTGRFDGSSRLAKGHQWAFFPSAALGWRITEESFLKDKTVLSDLKLRLSYGVSGNNSISPYQSTQGIVNDKYLFGNTGVNSAYIGNFENKNLTWEKTKEVNFGVDYTLFNGRLSGTVDIYNRRTDGILMLRKMSEMNGFASMWDNVGKVDNRGIELSLNTVNIKTKDFTWSTTINFTSNHNEIVELNDGYTEDRANMWFVGQPVGVVWTYKQLGIWQENEAAEAKKYGLMPGSIKVVDKDNSGTPSNNDDKFFLGSLFPKWTGGITNTFKYKDLDLSFFVYTRQGQYSFSQFHRSYSMNDNASFNVLKLNYWTPENPTGTWNRPGVTAGEADANHYMKTSFVKVGYINLGYNVPTKVLSKTGISKLRVFGSCQNPFVFTDYEGWDPETASENTYTQYAIVRSFMFGVNLTF